MSEQEQPQEPQTPLEMVTARHKQLSADLRAAYAAIQRREAQLQQMKAQTMQMAGAKIELERLRAALVAADTTAASPEVEEQHDGQEG